MSAKNALLPSCTGPPADPRKPVVVSSTASAATKQNPKTKKGQDETSKQAAKTAPPTQPPPRRSRGPHLTSLWSLWYGLAGAGLQLYLVVCAVRRFLVAVSLPWPDNAAPLVELNAYVALVGISLLLLPFFLASAAFKVGNLANDGAKLGAPMGMCSIDPQGILLLRPGGLFRNLWQHGAPTAPFLHLAAAFCLLVARLVLEAQLIKHGLLAKDTIWRTDLDFIVPARDRQIVLSFMATSPVTPVATINATMNPNTQDVLRTVALEPGEPEPISTEFINYTLALLVFAVRYPAVFWRSAKGFAALFSVQLIINGIQAVLLFAATSILYKVQLNNPSLVLPRSQPFLLDSRLILVLLAASGALIVASATVLHYYGLSRFQSFLWSSGEAREVRARMHDLDNNDHLRPFVPHCMALIVLLSLAACQAPLLADLILLYKASLDGAVLLGGLGASFHLLTWVILWLILTIKRRWRFKIHFNIASSTISSGYAVQLVSQVSLARNKASGRGSTSESPMLVVAQGQAYSILDSGPQRAILGVAQRASQSNKESQQQNQTASRDDDEEDIYWLRPKPPSPKDSPDSERGGRTAAWLARKKLSPAAKHKVTFEDALAGAGSPRKLRALLKSPRSAKTTKRGTTGCVPTGGRSAGSESEDDGDYATLRDLPLLPLPEMSAEDTGNDDTASEDNRLLDMPNDTLSFASGVTGGGCVDDDIEPPPPFLAAPVTVHGHPDEQGSPPRSQRSTDSGLPPGADSLSTGSAGSSASPPSGTSDASSGVHSNDQRAVAPTPWRSMSLQRHGPAPPPVPSHGWPAYGSLPPPTSGNQQESTVAVIRRKSSRPLTTDLTRPFERATNMRMTSFADVSPAGLRHTTLPNNVLEMANTRLKMEPQGHRTVPNTSGGPTSSNTGARVFLLPNGKTCTMGNRDSAIYVNSVHEGYYSST